jgi:hypothetical protein
MIKNLLYTVTGGVGLLLATIILQAFVSSPPTRAEFDKHKAESSRHLKSIDGNLKTIKTDQRLILNHLLRRNRNEKQIIKNAN